MIVLNEIGTVIDVVTIGLMTLKIIAVRNAFLGLAAASALFMIACMLWYPPIALVHAVCIAVALWVWWNQGGGDDTKKRLRKLKKKFTPVRRMAPVTA